MSAEGLSANFSFLSDEGRQLDRLGALAERDFADDPATCLIKLRQLGEGLARQVAARSGLLLTPDEPQFELLRRLEFERAAPDEMLDLFHQVRIIGNRAAHRGDGDHRTALTTLAIARQLAIWFHRTFVQEADFDPGPFVPPTTPTIAADSLIKELARLRAERTRLLDAAAQARESAEAARIAYETAEARASRIAAERERWAEIAQETEDRKGAVLADLLALQTAAAQATPGQQAQRRRAAKQAAKRIDLDEIRSRPPAASGFARPSSTAI